MPAKNTGAILQRLRSLMKNSHHVSESVHAYIIPTDDAHQVSLNDSFTSIESERENEILVQHLQKVPPVISPLSPPPLSHTRDFGIFTGLWKIPYNLVNLINMAVGGGGGGCDPKMVHQRLIDI